MKGDTFYIKAFNINFNGLTKDFILSLLDSKKLNVVITCKCRINSVS
jgi:hypothetical protein